MYLLTYFFITSLYKIVNINIIILLINFKNITDHKIFFNSKLVKIEILYSIITLLNNKSQ